MKPRNNKNLIKMKAYRFTPTLAHSVHATARSLNMSESEFVRVVLVDRLRTQVQFLTVELNNHRYIYI